MTLWQQNGAGRDDRGRLTGAGRDDAPRGAAGLPRLRRRVAPARARPHPHRARLGSARVTVRPRRARCPGCAATHVLLPAGLVLRRADTVEAIGTALTANARGDGHRTIAARLARRSPRCAAGYGGHEDHIPSGCMSRVCSTRSTPTPTSSTAPWRGPPRSGTR